jgi:superfamily II DNA or RNA helicase
LTRKEIVDNEIDSYTMAKFLRENIPRNPKGLDVASGYFNVTGYMQVRNELEAAVKNPDFKMRLLFGKELIPSGDPKEIENCEGQDPTVTKELEELEIDEKYARIVDSLIEFIKKDSVEIKQNPNRFNHAKCYIFEDPVALGSSNFTGAGLAHNVELNAVLYQPSAQQLVRDWFERRWVEGDPGAKVNLIKTLEESKFGAPLDPFTAYMKILYEYYKPRLEDIEKRRGMVIELTTFQEDAVNNARRILKKYSGVLVADSTGLGKTHIGLELLREYAAVERKKCLLIAPSQVLDSVWEKRLFDESIKTKNITLESTGTANFRPEEYLDIDVILIDESHNYRNANTNRHDNIMKVIAGGRRKKVILLTATPIQNSLMDLYNQISLVTAGDDAHFADIGIRDLRRDIIAADRKDFASGIDDIVRLLDELMIRRTRLFIKENYPDATINGEPIRFPTRQLRKIEYSLTSLFGDKIYDQVLETVDALNLTPYRVDSYIITLDEEERNKASIGAELQKIGLLKRFESSVEAIRKSVTRLVTFYRYFVTLLDEDKILDSPTFRKALQEYQDSEESNEDEFLDSVKEKLVSLTKEYNKRQMKRDSLEDLKKLEILEKSLKNIGPFADKKLIALSDRFVRDHVFETGGKKAVIFTQFVDTAVYVYDNLKADLKDKRVELLTGSTDKDTRARILREFAPIANNGGNVKREIDVLVCTDILSEGQNLQDANYAINYDLPWNPMRIVQRVGRVDRLLSRHSTVTSAVFIPEKGLEDLLKLMEKLQVKIQKIGGSVGNEATILGEKENPRNFNAISRIRKEDSTLIEDMERSTELLPINTPFQSILKYLTKSGAEALKEIPLGKRSGKKADFNGLFIFYREKGNAEGIHMLTYDYKNRRYEHYNEISWLFRRLECREGEPLLMPLKGYEAFRQFHNLDEKARENVLVKVNAPIDVRAGQKPRSKTQSEASQAIYDSYMSGKVNEEKASKAYEILLSENLAAWDEEISDYLSDYRRSQNISSLLTSLDQLFHKFKIDKKEKRRARILEPKDLEVIAYVFLSREDEKDIQQLIT